MRSMLCDKVKKTVDQPEPQQAPDFNEFTCRLESTLAKCIKTNAFNYL
jgi:hypothetical protein